MEVRINATTLTEKPYDGESDGLFSFNDSEVTAFVDELVFGNQACYLVSGYRGAGKTSFINRTKFKVEERSFSNNYKDNSRIPIDRLKKTKAGTLAPESYDSVFVYSSFAKYNNQTAFLRQLIRNLYLAFESRPTKDKPRINFLTKEAKSKLTKLYHRTFYDIKAHQEISNETSTKWEHSFESKVSELVAGVKNIVAPIIPASLANFLATLTSVPFWIPSILLIASIIWMIIGFFSIKRTYTTENKEKNSTSTSEIYDDEIAFHYFEDILRDLKKEGFKIVFVLDELDKVSDTEILRLTNEMKPYLLSGLADFIVVAGQTLTYRYMLSSSQDDDAISSMFSKSFHVSLKSVSELRDIIKSQVIQSGSSLDENLVDKFVNHHIFLSRRIPRILFTQIRQLIFWQDGQAFIRVTDNPQFNQHTSIVESIEDIVKTGIDPNGYRPVLRDYLIVQLYRVAADLESKKGKEIDIDSIMSEFSKSQIFYHASYFEFLAPCLLRLIYSLSTSLSLKLNLSDQAPKTEESTSTGLEKVNQDNTDDSVQQQSIVDKTLDTFKQELNDLNWVIRVSLMSLNDATSAKVREYNTLDLLQYAISEKFINISLPKDKLLLDILKEPKVLEDSSNLRRAYKITQESKFDSQTIINQFLESLIANQLSAAFRNSKVERAKDQDFDFLVNRVSNTATIDPENDPDLLVEFKFLRRGTLTIDHAQLLRNLIRYNTTSRKGNYFVLVVLTDSGQDTLARDIYKFNLDVRDALTARKLNADLANRIFIVMSTIGAPIANLKQDLGKLREKMERYRTVYSYDTGRPILHKDDIQKGRWGGKPEKNGRKLSAKVGKPSGGFYPIELRVEGIDENKPLEGEVTFYVHDTFLSMENVVPVVKNEAIFEISGHEAFTVGAVADYGETELELDLNQIDAPKGFKYDDNS